jgi:hypothetical protein
LPQQYVKPRKSNTSRRALPLPTVSFGKPSELDQPRLVLMEMKTELG